MMTNMSTNTRARPPSLWPPYLVAVIGIIISVILCLCLLYEIPQPIVLTLKDSLPWIVLISGALLAILIAVSVRLMQITHERSNSLETMNQEFKKEILEHMHAIESQQKMEKALLQSQKLQAIGTLAGGIAHDFNNILYAIMGYVEMAREDIDKENLIYKNLGKVLEASQRGQELVSRILTFSRRQHLEFKPTNLQSTIESVLELLKPTIPSSVNIQVDVKCSDCIILGDQTQMHQVILNMINNAVDAMDGEGNINIQLNRILEDDIALNDFPNIPRANYCKIEISDTGFGMDEGTAERIFEPFFTTKEVGKGTGLGLSTVHAIVQEQKGIITVKSQLGKGTTFTILLPEYRK